MYILTVSVYTILWYLYNRSHLARLFVGPVHWCVSASPKRLSARWISKNPSWGRGWHGHWHALPFLTRNGHAPNFSKGTKNPILLTFQRVEKLTKLGFFFPPFFDLFPKFLWQGDKQFCSICVTNNNLRDEQFEEWTLSFRKVGMNFSNTCFLYVNMNHFSKPLCRLVSKSRQYTTALCTSMSVCKQLKQERLLLCLGPLERVRHCLWTQSGDRVWGGVKFKESFVFWSAAVTSEQLLTTPALSDTCTNTFKVSFSQRGTLALTSCLSNLTSKGLGHLSLACTLYL